MGKKSHGAPHERDSRGEVAEPEARDADESVGGAHPGGAEAVAADAAQPPGAHERAGEHGAGAPGLRAVRGKKGGKAQKGKKAQASIDFQSTLTRDEAAAYFDSIIRGLRKGRIDLHRGQESVQLHPAECLDFKVKASKKGAKERLVFEFEWRNEPTRLEIVPGKGDPGKGDER